MKKLILSLVAGIMLAGAAPAQAKIAAVYASGMGGVQNSGATDPGLGLMLGARLLIFDGYIDYTAFGQSESVSRGILGLRGGFGSRDLRLVLRAGAGTIHEERGALTGPVGAPSRTGAVGRVGAALEAAVNPVLYIGFGFDAETYRFASSASGVPDRGSDVFATLHLTFELGV